MKHLIIVCVLCVATDLYSADNSSYKKLAAVPAPKNPPAKATSSPKGNAKPTVVQQLNQTPSINVADDDNDDGRDAVFLVSDAQAIWYVYCCLCCCQTRK